MRILSILAGLFLTFLLFMTGARFILLLLDVNKGNEVVHWILSRSDFWVRPFANLLQLSNRAVGDTGGFFEPASLIAFIVYAVIGGPYPEVPRAYPGIYAYLKHMGWVEAGPIREIYLIAPGTIASFADLLCEVQIPAAVAP